MPLPKIDTLTFKLTIPSLQQEMTFRPFLVKEEKILLMGQQGNSAGDMIIAIKQVINNCCLEELNVEDLASFDLEYLFIKLRARSVDNMVKLRYKDNEDEKLYDFEINLDEIEVQFQADIDKKIQINDKIGMIMKYPNVNAAERLAGIDDQQELVSKLLLECIETIYDENNVYPVNEYTEEEITEFVDSIDARSFKKVEEFFENMPKLHHTIHYTNELGHERTISLNSVQDFLA
jgi:hypothetical protein